MTQLIVLSVLKKKVFRIREKYFILRDECIPTMLYFFLVRLTTFFIVKNVLFYDKNISFNGSK